MSNQARKRLVAKIREEGRNAARTGKSRESNPYKFMSGFQWLNAFDVEREKLTGVAQTSL